MKMIEVISLLAVVITVVVVFWKFYSSAGWVEIEAEITHCEVEELYNRPGAPMSEGSKTFEYRINLAYQFQFEGRSYTGDKVYPGLPNVFSYKKDAENILKNYAKGMIVDIYADPTNPNNSSLFTSKQIPKKGFILLGVFMLTALVLIGGGIFYVSNKM